MFASAAIATLGIGIGSNTAIFSAIDAVLLHPLLYKNPDRLVLVTKNMPMFELSESDASALDFLDYRDLSKSFSGMAAFDLIVPVASAVEAEPMVWERFVSRIVARSRRARKAATVITAAGIEAEMVNPTRNPRYALAAPKTMPSTTPATAACRVNSRTGVIRR